MAVHVCQLSWFLMCSAAQHRQTIHNTRIQVLRSETCSEKRRQSPCHVMVVLRPVESRSLVSSKNHAKLSIRVVSFSPILNRTWTADESFFPTTTKGEFASSGRLWTHILGTTAPRLSVLRRRTSCDTSRPMGAQQPCFEKGIFLCSRSRCPLACWKSTCCDLEKLWPEKETITCRSVSSGHACSQNVLTRCRTFLVQRGYLSIFFVLWFMTVSITAICSFITLPTLLFILPRRCKNSQTASSEHGTLLTDLHAWKQSFSVRSVTSLTKPVTEQGCTAFETRNRCPKGGWTQRANTVIESLKFQNTCMCKRMQAPVCRIVAHQQFKNQTLSQTYNCIPTRKEATKKSFHCYCCHCTEMSFAACTWQKYEAVLKCNGFSFISHSFCCQQQLCCIAIVNKGQKNNMLCNKVFKIIIYQLKSMLKNILFWWIDHLNAGVLLQLCNLYHL